MFWPSARATCRLPPAARRLPPVACACLCPPPAARRLRGPLPPFAPAPERFPRRGDARCARGLTLFCPPCGPRRTLGVEQGSSRRCRARLTGRQCKSTMVLWCTSLTRGALPSVVPPASQRQHHLCRLLPRRVFGTRRRVCRWTSSVAPRCLQRTRAWKQVPISHHPSRARESHCQRVQLLLSRLFGGGQALQC